MPFQPILAALRKHRLATLLIALEIALACAVLCNACFLIANRLGMMQLVSGVDESSLAFVRLTGYDEKITADLNARVLAGLRGIPGMQSVSVINTVPFAQQRGASGITTDAAGQHFGGVVDFYTGAAGSIEGLGLRIVAGQRPQAEDYQSFSNFLPTDARVLVTRALAEHLWPGADPLGREFWMDTYHFRVTGVLAHLAVARPGGRGPNSADWSVFVPVQAGSTLGGSYLLRADPKNLPRVLRDAHAIVTRIAPDTVLDRDESRSVSDLRHEWFQRDRSMTGMLLGVIVALLLVTALGIVGLASFWVAQRRRQIGVRRALGATRGDILRYFQTENFLIVTLGIALGMLLAYALNLLLMTQYELPRLPLYYLPIGAIVLWLLGQLAVLGPALRAAAVPPVVATRSV